MAGPSGEPRSDPSLVRLPAVAGRFYPADRSQCRTAAQALLRVTVVNPDHKDPAASASRWMGAIVPHAGWICSGLIAGETIATLAESRPDADVVVVFGAIHTPLQTELAAFDPHGRWSVPGGESEIPVGLERKLAEASDLFVTDERFHRYEHAVEVELPLIQLAWPKASVLPVEVPVTDDATEMGQRVARQIEREGLQAVYLASSDLTHYGPDYRFTPAGVGLEGLDWAKANDARVLTRVTNMRPETIVPEVRAHYNACGAGAIAAMMSASIVAGATRARVLRHANSYEMLLGVMPAYEPDNAVGYAGVVLG